MKYVNIDYAVAHATVESNKNLFWDGWTIISWKQDSDAIYKKNGMFHGGKWGTAHRYEPNSQGWSVPTRYVAGMV